jgi:ATP-dependent helicase/nuclease subunit A
LSETLPLYEFWSTILNQGGREALYQRLGGAIDDSLNVFLQKARDFGQSGRTGLYHFVHSFRQSGGEIKRDFDARSQNEVRVMSMHGAKGLQAPVVFLPDTLRENSKTEPIANTEAGPLWVSGETELADKIASLKERQKKIRKDELDRLLYVALTRAEQALFISGWEKKNSRFYPGSWHELMVDTISNMAESTQPEEGVWQLASGQPEPETDALPVAGAAAIKVPDWFYKDAPEEPVPARPLNPSELDGAGDETPYNHADRHASLLAGSYAHKLFEYLPRQKPEDRKQAASLLARQFGDAHHSTTALSASQIDEIDAKVFTVLEHPDFEQLFGSDALTEQSVSGLIGNVAVTGQIDRMLIAADKVILLDFKTGRPPQDAQNLPQAYISQMASYGALIEQIYPDKQIICYLLWTQNCSLTEVTKTARDSFVATLG